MSIFPHQKVTLKSPWNPRRTSAEAAPQAMDPLIWQSPGPLLGSMAMWLWYGHQRWGESKHCIYIYIIYTIIYCIFFKKPYDHMTMDWPYVTIDLIELRLIYHHQFISFIWSPVYPSLGGPRQATCFWAEVNLGSRTPPCQNSCSTA